MQMPGPHRRKVRLIIRFAILGLGAGLFFVVLSDGLGDWYPIINGMVIGFIIAIFAVLFELFVYEARIRKLRFITVLLIRFIFYTLAIAVTILGEISVARMIKEGIGLQGLLQNEDFRKYVFEGEYVTSIFYAAALLIIVLFNRQVSRKIGHGVINDFVTGRYYHPVERDKIFMFLNLRSTEKIIKQLGRLKFHRFINEVSYDITIPVLNHFGGMYQYVEDEIVIIWRMKEGLRNANVIRCFFNIKDSMHEKRETYLQKYGIYPVFRGAVHCGKVVKGEIGAIKTEIVYHGDVLNTTSRILGACSKVHKEFLITSSLLEQLQLPRIFEAGKCGDMKLKGKSDHVSLFEVKEIDIETLTFG